MILDAVFSVVPVSCFLWVYFIILAPCCFEAELNNLQWMQMSLNILIPKFISKLKVRFTASWQQMEQYFFKKQKEIKSLFLDIMK